MNEAVVVGVQEAIKQNGRSRMGDPALKSHFGMTG